MPREDATDRLAQGFMMANYLVWLYSAMAVFLPWRPVVKLLWRLCRGNARTRQRKEQKQHFLLRVVRRIDLASTSMLLALLCFFVYQFHGMLIERVGPLSSVRRTLSNSTLCRMEPGETKRSFFRDSSAVAACIGAYALLKILIVARMAITTSYGVRRRCSETMPLMVLWEATQRKMGHALVVAFVDAVDEAGMQVERVLFSVSAKRLGVLASAMRLHCVRPAALLFQMACAAVAFGSACADDGGGASFSLVFSSVGCIYHVLNTCRVLVVGASTMLVRVHVDAARSGWRAGGDRDDEGDEGDEGDETKRR